MKPRLLLKTSAYLTSLLILLALACIPDQVSWSPDGKTLAFVRPADKALWLWDSESGKAKKIAGGGNEQVVSCRYLPSGDRVLFAIDKGVSAEKHRFEFRILDLKTGDMRGEIAAADDSTIALSGDGKRFFYQTDNKAQGTHDLWMIDLSDSKKPAQRVMSQGSEFAYTTPDATGSRILFTISDSIGIVDVDRISTKTLISGEPNVSFIKPVWMKDGKSFLCLRSTGEQHDMAELVSCTVEPFSIKSLRKSVYLFALPDLSPDGKSVAVGVINQDKDHIFRNLDSMTPPMVQIALIDIASGKESLLTNEAMGAELPSFDPTGKRLAYLTSIDFQAYQRVVVLELDTKKRTVIECDDEDKAFTAAESLARDGKIDEAIRAFEEFLAKNPNTRFKDPALYQLVGLYLDPKINDPDKAFAAMRKMDKGRRKYAESLFWREGDRIATDPAEDWIEKYGSEESAEKFALKTDLTRDLTALSARRGKENLYLRVDYNAARDLDGSLFQDTTILLDYNSPDQGYRAITASTDWDRGAERTLLYRNWVHADTTNVDVEMLDENGKSISRAHAAGRSNPDDADFDLRVLDPENRDGPGWLTFAITRQVLSLPATKTDISIQVCTTKGGIGSDDTGEHPRVDKLNGHPFCDVADAFGPENTTKRTDEDSLKGKPMIRGVAGKLPLP